MASGGARRTEQSLRLKKIFFFDDRKNYWKGEKVEKIIVFDKEKFQMYFCETIFAIQKFILVREIYVFFDSEKYFSKREKIFLL
jgi:hypothetical protein